MPVAPFGRGRWLTGLPRVKTIVIDCGVNQSHIIKGKSVATVGDVAREAGVSRSTVSAVITGRKAVTPATRKKVEAAIAKLNYTVNEGARALATSRTMIFGVVIRFHESEFSPALSAYLIALSDHAREYGYSVMLLTDIDSTEAIRTAIAGRRVDGLILLDLLEHDPRMGPIHASNFPAVLVGMPEDTLGIDTIDLDFAAAARLLVDQLADKGHRKALFIRWPEEVYSAGSTYATLFEESALARASRRNMELEPVSVPVSPEAVREKLGSLLRDPECPQALLIHNDAAVAMLPFVLRELSRSVPEDLSVVSLHSTELARLYALSYTSVETDPGAVSRGAVKRLVERISNPDATPSRELITPRLIQRGSVADV